MRPFHLGDILSVTTGRLVSPRHVEGVYDILNYMTGESLFTHQLPRACAACRPSLIGQHPQLADITGEDVTTENYQTWLATQIERFGDSLQVEPLKPTAYQSMDPIAEAVAMVGRERVIPIRVDEP